MSNDSNIKVNYNSKILSFMMITSTNEPEIAIKYLELTNWDESEAKKLYLSTINSLNKNKNELDMKNEIIDNSINLNNQNYIEQKIYKNHPKTIPFESLKIILNQIEKNVICRIIFNNGEMGTGFFCKFPFPNNYSLLPSLITNNHILNKNDIIKGKKIRFFLNNNDHPYEIIIDDNRKTFTVGKPYDMTLIEIKHNDGLDIKSFLEIADEIYENKPIKYFEQKSVYLLQHPLGNKFAEFSDGVILKITENNFNIFHNCSSKGGSSGGPIISLDNFKVFGIHKGTQEEIKMNLGTLINTLIKQFNEKYQNLNKNIINNEDIENKEKINNHKIETYNIIDIITINYKINFAKIIFKKLKIFGDKFVENNKNFCKIIINDKEYELTSTLNLKNIIIDNYIVEIKLKGINNITNMSNMINECEYLFSLPDISNWNTNKITDISYIFYNCSSLKSLPDISKWNTNNVNNMDSIFSGCSSLLSLPEISKWNTNNVNNMNAIFYNCSSLKFLPDISKWNTKNVNNMSHLFHNCSKLESLPDISKWETDNVTNMCYMFSKCSSISSLPDISKWNTVKVTNMESMFLDCKSLNKLPDLTEWNTNNVTNYKNMFSGCKKKELNIPKRFQNNYNNDNNKFYKIFQLMGSS